MELNKIYQGDCLKVLQTFPDKTIDCVITSPPYWALRDYGVEGQFGLEPTYKEYINKLCDIFDEIKRILKDEGTIWVNLGDTYNSHPANSKNVGGFEGEQMRNNPAYAEAKVIGKRNCDLPDKCLVQIPARFALEMANRGWILRNEIIWYKRNCMPSSITDRFTVDFEKIFFFTKQKKYWFEPQYEPHQWKDKDNLKLVGKKCKMDGAYNCAINWKGRERSERYGEFGRNKRCVWDITTKPFKEAHFATFPEALIETPIKAGCPEMICSKCHQARKKVYQKKEYIGPEKEITGKYANSEVHSAGAREHYLSEQRKFTPDQKAVAKFIKGHITSKYHLGLLDNEFGKTTWEHWIRTDNSGACLPSPEDYRKLKGILELPTDYDEAMLTTVKVLVDDKGGKDECIGHSDCGCGAEWIPGVVLDPFMGSGTTGLVAKKLKRSYVGIELNPDYIEMANRRISEYGTE